MKAKRFKVLVVTHTESLCSQRVLTGITDGIAEAGSVEVRILKSSAAFTTENVRRALKGGVNGIIVSHPYNGEPSDLLFKSHLPIVTVHPLDAVLARHSPNLYAVMSDADAIGLRATQFFMSQRRFCSYAYVGARDAPDWSVRRGQAYVRALLAQGEDCRCYESHKLAFDRRQLADFIRSLRRPAAVFAANDERAIEILDVCRHLDIKIPEEISLLGVDNDVLLCQHASTSLSSIEPDSEEAGRIAVKVLLSVLGGRPPLVRNFTYGIRDIVVRESALLQKPSALLVERALSFIRQHAFEPIGAQDVANHLHASRQLVNLRFREQGKCSVLAAITTVRINEAKRLLTTTDTKISAITAAVGYTSEKYFKALFLRETGMTMSDWRRRHLSSKSDFG